jgi:hypothetical protein
MKSVIDEFGKETVVDDQNRRLYTYNNSKKEIVYNAEVMENGKGTGFYVNYIEKGTVSDIEEKLKTWNNRLLLLYAATVGFKASENDPDKKIYNKLIQYVKENEDKFFTKGGDFRKKFLISDSEIRNLMK